MFTPTIGWGVRRRIPLLMADSTAPWAVLRTTDGGAHWRDVSPPGVSREARAGVVFLDASAAWLLLPSATSEALTLFHTADSGATWQRSDLHTAYSTLAYGGAGLQFLDPLHGWLLVQQHTVGMLTGPAVLYGTADGGGTWTLLSNTASSTAGHLEFVTPQVGWAMVLPSGRQSTEPAPIAWTTTRRVVSGAGGPTPTRHLW